MALTGYKGAPLGTITPLNTLNAATSLAIPTGCDCVQLQCFTQNIRFTDCGTTPTSTIGYKLTANTILILDVIEGQVIKCIEETSAATMVYTCYKAHKDTNA